MQNPLTKHGAEREGKGEKSTEEERGRQGTGENEGEIEGNSEGGGRGTKGDRTICTAAPLPPATLAPGSGTSY